MLCICSSSSKDGLSATSVGTTVKRGVRPSAQLPWYIVSIASRTVRFKSNRPAAMSPMPFPQTRPGREGVVRHIEGPGTGVRAEVPVVPRSCALTSRRPRGSRRALRLPVAPIRVWMRMEWRGVPSERTGQMTGGIPPARCTLVQGMSGTRSAIFSEDRTGGACRPSRASTVERQSHQEDSRVPHAEVRSPPSPHRSRWVRSPIRSARIGSSACCSRWGARFGR